MKKTRLACATAALALAAPVALAQSAVTSSSGMAVGTVAGAAVHSQAATPAAPVRLLPGASTVAAGPPQVSTEGNRTTTVTRYWVNVPPGVDNDRAFRRWQRLR